MKLVWNAIYLAWSDTRARYKKSVLGPLWLTLGNLIGVLGLSVVWATLLKEDYQSFVPSLTIGLIVWQLISGTIGEASSTFTRQAAMIKNVVIPAWFFVVRAFSRQLINLIHNILIVFAVIIYFDMPMGYQVWFVFPGLLLVILNLLWIMYLLGLLGARFHDVEYLINSILPLLFFISPVIFRPDRLPVDLEIIWLNPFSYFVEVVRAPLLGSIPDAKSYIVLGVMSIIGGGISFFFHHIRGRRIVFWV